MYYRKFIFNTKKRKILGRGWKIIKSSKVWGLASTQTEVHILISQLWRQNKIPEEFISGIVTPIHKVLYSNTSPEYQS